MEQAEEQFKQNIETGRRLFTAPMGLEGYLTKPVIKIDLIPVIDLMVVALLFALLFTRFVVFPGVRVELPDTNLKMHENLGSVAVLTIGNEGMLLFDGKVFETKSIAIGFDTYIEKVDAPEPVLLVKANAGIELQAFLDLCQMAQQAGFSEIQISGQETVTAKQTNSGSLSRMPSFSGFSEDQ